MRKILFLVFILFGIDSFALKNLSFSSKLAYSEDLSDIWGYADTAGNEYALVGLFDGLSIVNVTDPNNITELFRHYGANCTWRDIKTWQDHAYVVSECFSGILIYDLSGLPSSVDTIRYDGGFNSCHNIYIDENGFAYVFGPDVGKEGAMIFDLTNPKSPTYVGTYDEANIHDGFVRGDTLWASEISKGQFSVVDVSDKASPVILATQETPHLFTHNDWLSDDGDYLFTTDEKSNAYVVAYDVSDLNNIQEVDRYRSNPGSGVIPHNTFYHKGYLVTSYYKDGVIIIDGNRPQNLVEVGNYDTYPFAGDGFDGCWGVYPYLPSENIIASDIQKGLFVLTPDYIRACYIEGSIADSICGELLTNASIEVLGLSLLDDTDDNGEFKFGTPDSGTYDIVFSAPGYISDTIENVQLQNGIVSNFNIKLYSPTAFNLNGNVVEILSRDPLNNVQVIMEDSVNSFTFTTDVNGEFTVCNFLPGNYKITTGEWGYQTKCIDSESLNSSNKSVEIELAEGYYDDFSFDFDWTVGGPGQDGVWARVDPTGTTGDTSLSNPEDDINTDCFDKCYVTGNGGGAPGNDDVDNGPTILSTPAMNLSLYPDPFIKYYRWFYNGYQANNPDDTMYVKITNGVDTAIAEIVSLQNSTNSIWMKKGFWVRSHFTTDLSSIYVLFEASDLGQGNWVEAGIDGFEVVDSLGSGFADDLIIKNTELQVYPNPFNDQIQIQYQLVDFDITQTQLKVTDILGRIISNIPIYENQGTVYLGKSLSTGLYLLQIIDASNRSKVVKVMKVE